MSEYDSDILAWSERQGALLRRVAAGERVNDTDLDWPNIAEEIESVGRSEFHAVESLLLQALVHMLKAMAWPDSLTANSWRREARLFRWQAKRRFSPSMRQRIDLADVYGEALESLPDAQDGKPPLTLPPDCPFTLDELLTSR